MAMHCLTRNLSKHINFVQPHRWLRSSFGSSKYKVKIGDELPDITVYEKNPSNHFSIRDIFTDKKGILFSVVGAFMPGCKNHIPEYLDFQSKFKEEGYETIACVSVNDPWVMAGWGKVVDPQGKIRMLADMKCEFTKAINNELDTTTILGSVRSKRYALLIDNNVITHISSEPDVTGLACLLCIQKMKD